MSFFTPLPSGRIAHKQTDNDAFSVYGPDDKTFITSLSFADINEMYTAMVDLIKYEALTKNSENHDSNG